MKKFDVAIVGGGLAGLTASIYLAKAGRKVIVLEKSSRFGGRGMTINKNGICMNLGAHALYRGGTAFLTFNELGMNLPGGIPSTKAHGIWKGIFSPYQQISAQFYQHHYFRGLQKYNSHVL